MPSSLTLYRQLRDCDRYLSQYPRNHRSTHFEELVCQAFAGLLYLPFYDADNDDTSKEYRVTWLGSANSSTKAPPGPDGIAWAHGFRLVIEPTRKTGTKQWSQEFAPCLDHARTVAEQSNMDPTDIWTVLVVTKTHQDTYETVRTHNPRSKFKIVLMELDWLRVAIETSFLAFTIRHIETGKLLRDLSDCVSSADSLGDFQERAGRCVDDWQKRVLELEKAVVVAVRSYAAMIKVARGHVGVTEILARLVKDPVMKWYFGRAQGYLGLDVIADSLRQESLGEFLHKIPIGGEELFSPVPIVEFESRCQRRLQAVREADARG